MKITYKIEELDCAHCAAKIEAEISKLPGVEKANVNYLSEKITLICENEIADLGEKVRKIAETIEPDCKVTI